MTLQLPTLPEGYSFLVKDYIGNSEDGYYREGERVLVALYKKHRILGIAFNIRVGRLPAYIVNPAAGEQIIQKSINDIWDAYQARERGKQVAKDVIAQTS